MCGHRHDPRLRRPKVLQLMQTGGPEGATRSSSTAGTAQGPGSASPAQPPNSSSTAGHLSKGLGAERVPLRVAWRSSTLTKVWQGAVGGERPGVSCLPHWAWGVAEGSRQGAAGPREVGAEGGVCSGGGRQGPGGQPAGRHSPEGPTAWLPSEAS